MLLGKSVRILVEKCETMRLPIQCVYDDVCFDCVFFNYGVGKRN